MKGIISHLATVLLVALTITWVSAEAKNQTQASIPTECPADNKGDAVHIAHESDCGLFYKCNHGEKVLHTCPSGLAFNPALQVCDWPENVGCTPGSSDDTHSGISSSTTEAASVSSEGPGSGDTEAEVLIPTECPAENGDYAVHIAHESNCGLFYKCDHGAKVLQNCPASLAFNPVIQVCDWPENVGCTPGSSDDTDGSDSGISSSSSAPEVESTSESGHNNIVASSTTEAASVSSEGPGSGNTEAEVVIPTECPAENGDYAVHIAHESNCGLFYKCDHGKKVLQECPASLAFNPALQVCDWPENVGCTPGSSDDTDGSDSGISSSSSAPEVESTSESGHNNIVTNSTTEAALVSSEGPGSGNTEAEVVNPTECPAENGDYAVHIAHESNCGLFYKCDHGEKVLQNCPANLAFNPVIQVCDWPENVGCTPGSSDDTDDSDSGISSSSSAPEVESTSESGHNNIVASSTTEAVSVSSEGPGSDDTEAEVVIPTECPAENGDYAVHIAHETDCGLFYQCNHGEKVLMQCASGLAFNPKEQVCDWAKNVECTPGSSDDTDGNEAESITESGDSSSSAPDVNDSTENDSDSPEDSDSDDLDSSEDSGSGEEAAESVIPTKCPATNEGKAVHIAHESDCGSFYKCNHGEKVEFKCPSGLHFNAALQVCDWPTAAKCTVNGSDDSGNSDSDNSASSDSNEIGSSTESNSNDSDEKDSGNNVSDNSEDSDSDETESQPITVPTKCPATNGDYTVQIAHESDCSLFYKCDNGKKVTLNCPSGLHFNADLQVCDWPASAGCIQPN